MVSWKPTTQTFGLISKQEVTRSSYACEFLLDKAKSSLLTVLAEDPSRLRVFADSRQSTDRSAPHAARPGSWHSNGGGTREDGTCGRSRVLSPRIRTQPVAVLLTRPPTPPQRGSIRGNQLQPRAAFHLGTQPNRFLRLALPTPAHIAAFPNAAAANAAAAKSTKNALLWASLQGSLGFFSPVDEVTFRRLSFLATKMVTGVPHLAGLNPRSHRAHDSGAGSAQELKSVVDVALLAAFPSLDCAEQDKLAQQIGLTPQKLLSSMGELEAAASLF